MKFSFFFIPEGDCVAMDSPVVNCKKSLEESGSAKHFFLKFTECDRPTVKLAAKLRRRSSFLNRGQGNIVCSRVGPSLQELSG